jgi:hypothetical protein
MSVLRYKTVWPFNISSMQKFHAALFAALVVLVSGATSFAVATFMQERGYGVSLPQGPAVFETSLQSRISSSDTSMTLVANSVRGGSTLSGYQCFTIDEGRSDMEFVCGTVSGTTVSSLERGIDPLTGTSTNSTVKFAHRVGSNVKVTDFPLIQRLRNLTYGIEQFPNLLSYDTDLLIVPGSPTSTLATKYYVDNTAFSGAPDADEDDKGIGELATAAEAAAGTSLGTTLARLLLPASLANATPSASIIIPVTSGAGKLAQGFLDLTQHFSFTSLFATSASSTNATTTNQTITALSSAIIKADASGNLREAQPGVDYLAGHYTYATTTNISVVGGYATSSHLTIPAGTFSASSSIEIDIQMSACTNSSGGGTCTVYVRDSNGVEFVNAVTGSVDNGESGGQSTMRAVILSHHSTSAQRSVATSFCINPGTPSTQGCAGGEGNSSINLAQDLTLSIVIQGAPNTTATLAAYSVVINP